MVPLFHQNSKHEISNEIDNSRNYTKRMLFTAL